MNQTSLPPPTPPLSACPDPNAPTNTTASSYINSSISSITHPRKRTRYASTSSHSTICGGPVGFLSGMDLEALLTKGVSYNFVNNDFVLSKSRAWYKVYDPCTQGFLTRVPESTAEEVEGVVRAAREAAVGWKGVPGWKRRMLMLQFVNVLRQQGPRIRHILCIEVGKTLADAEAEFTRAIDSVETACSVTTDLTGLSHTIPHTTIHTVHEPLGTTLSITPFNFPLLIPLWSIPYSLLAGNTVILKPSEKTPTVSQILAECFLTAGFPRGIVNVVHGARFVVGCLLSQPSIKAVSFVGSDVAGEGVYEHAKATRKRIQAECSGKNHGIVLPDANKMKTLYALAGSAFGAAGQRCMSLSVAVFVGDTVGWIPELIAISQRLVVGCGLDPTVEVGPVINRDAKDHIEAVITTAAEEGATVALDGRGLCVTEYPEGNFVGPTILIGVRSYMSCYQEEIFGPVLVCVEVDTLEEAVDLVNGNRYGNGVTLFTSSPVTAQVFQEAVNVGQIGINVPILAPAGPILRTTNKDSFLGDLNVHGRSYWQFYTQTKTISSIWHH